MLSLFDQPEDDIDHNAKRMVKCSGCKGRGIRVKQTIHVRDGSHQVCGSCHGEGFILIDPNARAR